MCSARFGSSYVSLTGLRHWHTLASLRPKLANRDVLMVDIVSPETRSWMMAQVKSKDTKPEMLVRRLTHGLGYRYRLHRRDLPGQPDLVFAGKRSVIFVNGCFWHFHTGCEKSRVPSTNRDYWLAKLEGNLARDAKNIALLEAKGWSVMTVWECQADDVEALAGRLALFLGRAGAE